MLKRSKYYEKKLNELFDKETLKKFKEFEEKPLPKYIRVNTLKTSIEELQELMKKRVEFERIKSFPEILRIKKSSINIGSSIEYLNGYYYIQDPTSLIAVKQLNPKESEIILDCCAAPGGKTTFMAQEMKNKGVIIAMDINKQKVRSLRSNIERMGVKNTIIIRGDVLKSKEYFPIKFDKILIDAPCTGIGVVRKDKKRAETLTEKEVKYFSEKQKKIIDAVTPLIKKKGVLVYSTCSILPEENEEQVKHILSKGFKLKEKKLFLNYELNTNCFFTAGMIKK